jgi:hypothetical protein
MHVPKAMMDFLCAVKVKNKSEGNSAGRVGLVRSLQVLHHVGAQLAVGSSAARMASGKATSPGNAPLEPAKSARMKTVLSEMETYIVFVLIAPGLVT